MVSGLARNNPDEVVFSLVKLYFDKWSIIEAKRAELKWEAQVNRRKVKNLPKYTLHCGLKWLPKEVITFINLQNVLQRLSYCFVLPTLYKTQDSGPDIVELLEEVNYNYKKILYNP